MLRISQVDGGSRIVSIRLEGRIAGPWVAEMGMVCQKLLDEGRLLSLDLSDVLFADQNGVAALANFKALGVVLINCSPFLAEQLKSPAPNA